MGTDIDVTQISFQDWNHIYIDKKNICRFWGKTFFYINKDSKGTNRLYYTNISIIGRFFRYIGIFHRDVRREGVWKFLGPQISTSIPIESNFRKEISNLFKNSQVAPSPEPNKETRITIMPSPSVDLSQCKNDNALEMEEKLSSPENIKKYYLDPPKNVDVSSTFNDKGHFITADDLAFLLDDYVQKHQNHHNYDVSNVKVVQDNINFTKTNEYLDSVLPILKNGESIKILSKTKRTFPFWGVHCVPLYIRRENDMIAAFIFDAAKGICVDLRDDFKLQVDTILKSCLHHKLNVRVIKSSTILQADWRNCPVYALKAMKFFIKNGHTLFSNIKSSDLVPTNNKLTDQGNDHIFHLKVASLPAHLLKLTNYHDMKNINQFYEKLPLKRHLLPIYYDNMNEDEVFYTKTSGEVLGRQKDLTLAKYLQLHTKKIEGGSWNFAAIEKMNKYRLKISAILKEKGIINEENILDMKALQEHLEHLKERIIIT